MSDTQICIMKNFNKIHYNAESVRKCNYIFMLLQINSPRGELFRNNSSIFEIACICHGYLQVLLINGRYGSNLKRIISNWLYRIVVWALTFKIALVCIIKNILHDNRKYKDYVYGRC